MTPHRPLAGMMVALSVSEATDTQSCGFPDWQVTRTTLQIVAALIGQGVGLIFGHDWRDDGVMEAVHSFARQVQPTFPDAPEHEGVAPLLHNYLPWPDEPRLSEQDQERLAGSLLIRKAGLPAELIPFEARAKAQGPSAPLYRYLRARSLTALRQQMASVADAMFCLGGRRQGSQGRLPGVLEEAFLMIRRKRPIYLAGLLGGVTSDLIGALEMREMPSYLHDDDTMAKLYAEMSVKAEDLSSAEDRQVDATAAWKAFRNARQSFKAGVNGLSLQENEELFATPVLDRAVQLVLTGLARLKGRGSLEQEM